MHDAGAWLCKIDLFTFGQVRIRILYQIIIRIPVYAQYNRGFQLSYSGLTAYEKTESQLVAVISRFCRRGSDVCIMYFTALYVFAVTPVSQGH